MLKKYLRGCSTGTKRLLHGILFCGDNTLPTKNAVFVVTSEKDGEISADYHQVLRCRSPWACPYCAPYIMAQKGKRIAAAIEALDKEYKQNAAMITFTIPHTRNMTCSDTFEILKSTWRRFTRAGRRGFRTKNHTLTNGEKIQYKIRLSPYGEMVANLNCTHSVRVYEFTWGENSWHPHIHALFWAPKDKFGHFVDYEESVGKYWYDCARAESIKFWTAKWNDNEKAEKYVNALFNHDYYGFTISKNKNGTTRKVESSFYISGWTGDNELTNMKAKTAHNGHFSVFQLLEEAKKAEDWDAARKWLGLFTEYALATKSARRVQFSMSNINAIIDKWLEENPLSEIHTKNFTETATKKVVYWFNNEEWYTLSCFEILNQVPIKAMILEKARAPDAQTEILELLAKYDMHFKKKSVHPEQEKFERVA